MRIVVAMSGGVDSAVAAALLAREGHEVVGVTLQLADLSADGLGVSRCCAPIDVEMARAVAGRLGIAHHVLDMTEPFRRGRPRPLRRILPRGRDAAPLRPLQRPGEVRRAAAGGRAVRGARRWPPATTPASPTREGGPALLRGREPREGPVVLPVRPVARAARARPLPARRADQGRGPRRRARASACPTPGGATARRSASCPRAARTRDVLERLAPERLPGAGEIVDRDGRVVGRHGGLPPVHRRPAPRPRGRREGPALRRRGVAEREPGRGRRGGGRGAAASPSPRHQLARPDARRSGGCGGAGALAAPAAASHGHARPRALGRGSSSRSPCSRPPPARRPSSTTGIACWGRVDHRGER